jgi:hypothetical protein
MHMNTYNIQAHVFIHACMYVDIQTLSYLISQSRVQKIQNICTHLEKLHHRPGLIQKYVCVCVCMYEVFVVDYFTKHLYVCIHVHM